MALLARVNPCTLPERGSGLSGGHEVKHGPGHMTAARTSR
jgi:hypothetical protein